MGTLCLCCHEDLWQWKTGATCVDAFLNSAEVKACLCPCNQSELVEFNFRATPFVSTSY